MPIPTYEDLMLPILKYLSDNQEHTNIDCIEFISNNTPLTEEEKRETLSSGDKVINNRTRWAVVYLRKAGLIENRKRGYFVISQIGRDILTQNPKKIDDKFLSKFEIFKKFKNVKESKDVISEDLDRIKSSTSTENTPEETIDSIVKDLKHQLVEDLLERIKENNPQKFENLVIELLLKMGYGS